MTIHCRCPSCGAHLRVAEKHAGRRVKCPKCAGVIAVADAAPPKKLPVAKPIEPPGPCPTASEAETPPADAEPIMDRDQARTDPAGGGLPNIVVDPEAGPLASRRGGRKANTDAAEGSKPKTGKPVWLLAGCVTAAALAVVVTAVLLYHFGGSWLGSADQQRSVLVLDWPASERGGAAVYVDDRKQELPQSGPAEFTLKPGTHRIVMLRRGYEQVETRISLGAGQRQHYRPCWTPSAIASVAADRSSKPGGDWLQDMEVAKRQAAGQNKDILIVFEGSDWSEESIRMRKEIFSQREFREQVDWRFVLVAIDFPQKDEAKARVEDPPRNKRLAETYHVSQYPKVVLTDAETRPYAVEGYLEGGVEPFVERLGRWQGVRERRDSLFLSVEMAKGDQKLKAVEEAADLLKRMELAQFYRPTLNQWLALVRQRDADNHKGAYEAVFEVSWLARLAEVDEKDLKEIRPIIAELDDWKKKFEFKDPDRAALMHLYAAARLAQAEQSSDALKYVQQAKDYQPKDPLLLAMLEQAEAALGGYGSGTGFVVAADGYILTNHHVIEGESKNSVRLPHRKEPVPAQVHAQNPERDIALLKIQVPDGLKLKPLHIATAEVHRGAGVGAFGFPGGEAIGTGLKLTTGVVSAEPDQSKEKMYLLDCRINPGNSGGPLCDTRGNVIGMVTAKIGGFGMDSYGMALPAKDLRAFLKKHLPRYEQPEPPEADQTRLEWDEIDRIVSPSVVMIIKSR
jgi:hypothetical protein